MGVVVVVFCLHLLTGRASTIPSSILRGCQSGTMGSAGQEKNERKHLQRKLQ